jgi:DNA-binding MarR family transcriptional regulator
VGVAADDTLDEAELETWISLIRVGQLLPVRLDDSLRALGTTLPRYEILAVLSRSPHGVRMTELCERALVSKPRVTVHVGELVEEGLVRRRPDPHDGRASIVTITAKGRTRFHRWRSGHRALARQLVIDALSANELRALSSILARIRDALGDTVDVAGLLDRNTS